MKGVIGGVVVLVFSFLVNLWLPATHDSFQKGNNEARLGWIGTMHHETVIDIKNIEVYCIFVFF